MELGIVSLSSGVDWDIAVPSHHDGFLTTEGNGSERLYGLLETFENGYRMAAWRAVVIAEELNRAGVPQKSRTGHAQKKSGQRNALTA